MDVVAIVVSDDLARAPFSGARAAVVVVEALKTDRGNDLDVIGAVIFGDLLRLRWDGGELDVLARHVTYAFTSMWQAPPPAERVPAELVPMLQRGATAFRERLIKRGDRVRVRRAGDGVRIDEVLPFDP